MRSIRPLYVWISKTHLTQYCQTLFHSKCKCILKKERKINSEICHTLRHTHFVTQSAGWPHTRGRGVTAGKAHHVKFVSLSKFSFVPQWGKLHQIVITFRAVISVLCKLKNKKSLVKIWNFEDGGLNNTHIYKYVKQDNSAWNWRLSTQQ